MKNESVFPLPCVCFTCSHFTVCEHRARVIELYNNILSEPCLALSNINCAYYDYSPNTQYAKIDKVIETIN